MDRFDPLHRGECMEGAVRAEGSGDSRPCVASDSSRGTGLPLTSMQGILDLNFISCFIHHIDIFLPGSSLPVMSSCCLSYMLSVRQT